MASSHGRLPRRPEHVYHPLDLSPVGVHAILLVLHSVSPAGQYTKSTPVEVIGPKLGQRPRLGEKDITRADPIPPVLNVDPLASGSFASGQVTLTGTAYDRETGLKSLRIILTGETDQTVSVDATGHFAVSSQLPVNSSADGVHSFTVVAEDRSGNTTTSKPVSFTLDTKASTVQLNSPPSGETLQTSPQIRGIASDGIQGSGVICVRHLPANHRFNRRFTKRQVTLLGCTLR